MRTANGGAAMVQGFQVVARFAEPGERLANPDLGILRLNRRPAPALPLDIFGPAWGRWIEGAAQASACSPDYVAAPLLAAASATVGNARWAEAAPGWCEPPHLWCASVGDSGSGKSPGADALHRHVLPELERRLARHHPAHLQAHRAKAELAKAQHEQWEKVVRTAARNDIPPPAPPIDAGAEPMAPRLVQHDITIEMVARLLATAAPKGLLMHRDELAGWLLGMSTYNDGARPFWLEAYGGRPYRVERVKHHEPIVIPHLALAWFGGIQPARLAEVMREADDGLLARFCWFWPEAVPFGLGTIAPDIPFAIEAFERMRMLDLAPADNANGQARPVTVPLAAAARDYMVAFGQEMQARQECSGGLMRSALGKARGLALRLSLVLAHLWWAASDISMPPPAEISARAFAAAAAIVADYLMPMAERTYGDAACSPEQQRVTLLARWIARERATEVHVRRMLREVRLPGLTEAAHVHAAATALIDAGWLIPMPSRPNGAERARAAWPVNPRLYEVLRQ